MSLVLPFGSLIWCGDSEARIRKVQHIMSSKIFTPTASAPSSTPLSPTSLAVGESASDASTVNQSPRAGTFMPTSNYATPAIPSQAASTFDVLPGSSSASSPTSISVSAPSGSLSSLNQVLMWSNFQLIEANCWFLCSQVGVF